MPLKQELNQRHSYENLIRAKLEGKCALLLLKNIRTLSESETNSPADGVIAFMKCRDFLWSGERELEWLYNCCLSSFAFTNDLLIPATDPSISDDENSPQSEGSVDISVNENLETDYPAMIQLSHGLRVLWNSFSNSNGLLFGMHWCWIYHGSGQIDGDEASADEPLNQNQDYRDTLSRENDNTDEENNDCDNLDEMNTIKFTWLQKSVQRLQNTITEPDALLSTVAHLFSYCNAAQEPSSGSLYSIMFVPYIHLPWYNNRPFLYAQTILEALKHQMVRSSSSESSHSDPSSQTRIKYTDIRHIISYRQRSVLSTDVESVEELHTVLAVISSRPPVPSPFSVDRFSLFPAEILTLVYRQLCFILLLKDPLPTELHESLSNQVTMCMQGFTEKLDQILDRLKRETGTASVTSDTISIRDAFSGMNIGFDAPYLDPKRAQRRLLRVRSSAGQEQLLFQSSDHHRVLSMLLP